MAKMHSTNALYSGRPGGLDIEWTRTYFFMDAQVPWDISVATFYAALEDDLGNELAQMAVTGTPYGTTSGLISCTMEENIMQDLPPVSHWYLNQIQTGHTYPKFGGAFTILEDGDA
jgi:hypothetical protein